MADGPKQVRCPWNQLDEDPNPRQCSGWDGMVPTVICEACDNARTTWLTRLLSEEHTGISRRELLTILNRHKSYTTSRQVIRIMQQHRAVDMEISSEAASKILAGEGAPPHTPSETSAVSKIQDVGTPSNSSPADAEHANASPAPPHVNPAVLTRGPSLRRLENDWRSRRTRDIAGPANVRSEGEPHGAPHHAAELKHIDAAELKHIGSQPKPTPHSDADDGSDAGLEEAFVLRRALKQELRLQEAREKREQAKQDLAARRVAANMSRVTVAVPPEFVVLARTFEPTAQCKAFQPSDVVWDEREKLTCPKCGKASLCSIDNCQPLVIGEKDHLYRAIPLTKYGAVVCVPSLICQSRPGCCVGFSKSMIAVMWDKKWVKLEDLLTVEGAGDQLLEVPTVLCKERVILHVLHWYAKTKEAREDDHAGLPPCGVDREAAVVYRKDHAAGYCTFSSDLAETDEGFRLPTFYNIFVRLAYRKYGCARQMLTWFFRPQDHGKARYRRRLREKSGGKPGELEQVVVRVPAGIDQELDFIDMLQIDPPVSNALTTCMSKILSPVERNNIVCDTGKYEGGCMIYVIDPSDPKTRVFKPAADYRAMPRGKGQEVSIGGVSKVEDAPLPDSITPLV